MFGYQIFVTAHFLLYTTLHKFMCHIKTLKISKVINIKYILNNSIAKLKECECVNIKQNCFDARLKWRFIVIKIHMYLFSPGTKPVFTSLSPFPAVH